MQTLIKFIMILFIIFLNLKCADDDSGLVNYIFFSDDLEHVVPVGVGDSEGDNIIITHPFPGRNILESDGLLVEWEIIGNISSENITIGISLNSGATWQDIHGGGNVVNNPINSSYYSSAGSWTSVVNDGSHLVFPDLFETSDKVLIGIWSEDAYTEHYKILDDYITITADSNYFEIISPNGGESIRMNESYIIEWTYNGNVSSYLKLYYNVYDIYDEESWILITSSTYNDGAFIWSVPSFTSTRPNCRVKIIDVNNTDIYDISDNAFTIIE